MPDASATAAPSLVRRVAAFFAEPPAAPPIADPDEVKRRYAMWRTRMLYGSLVGYALFYVTRKNIAVALPLLSRDLGYSNTDLGLLGSLMYVSYAVAKGTFGFLGDRADPRRFLAVGLLLSGAANLLFAASSGLFLFGLWWTLNGVFLATGAPGCAKVVARWFSVSERGTMWGVWNTSHQIGGGLSLVLAGWLASEFGWRAVFWGPGLVCIAGAFFVLDRLRDRPEAMGLPPIDVFRNDPEAAVAPAPKGERYVDLVVRRVLLNPHLATLAFASMFVYVVRTATVDWVPKYLFEAKGMELDDASRVASLVEFIGIPGSLATGWVSDRFFAARRAPIVVIFLLLLAASVGALHAVPPGHPWLDAAAIGAIGFFTYGPLMVLAGVGAADTCGAEVAAAAVGVVGILSYVGAAVSSLGTGAILDTWGWDGAFGFWGACALIGSLLLLPLWNARGRRA
jgi:OPA family sugar phosphate sensor protein UhpC-like MFS transporter